MSDTSKSDFLSAAFGAYDALTEPHLQSRSPVPSNTRHNERAKLLRRGLYVVSFNLLEDFMKKRMSACLDAISLRGVPFADLPDKLQEAAIVSAFSNGLNRSSFDRLQKKQVLQEVAAAVASTSAYSTYQIHKYSLLHSGSNITSDEINKALQALHIERPWETLNAIAASTGIGGIPIVDRFKSCLQTRHEAAHNLAAVEISDIDELLGLATLLAFGFDTAISAGTSRILDKQKTTAKTKKIEPNDISVHTVEEFSSGWGQPNRLGRPTKLFESQRDAVWAVAKRKKYPDVVLAKRLSGGIADWEFADPSLP
ncbi:MAE_28990/MAE_18760 family HEPN-like nuclease [Gordonia alkanivorans]|uniref:MAE_28990/MAE_18760 family HEPN-like nuclease n=1 Tax=Gordonia alkanivorans TaxID=84096 RepID=UPI00244A7301|nr:MAE_28990/MAE_18760 family HEPN-like nuclease [Gordonia alkanivorans]MDH3044034.1 MAE_28990/MAE_18760 family HEPN-like nuclease [Gordonia alkanivorans]